MAPALTFFFPYREVSGCPVLFSMLARHLAATGRGPIRVVDYADGYMARVLRGEEGVELQRFEVGVPCRVGPGGTLVLQSGLPYAMRPELWIHPDTRVVFWHLFPYNLVHTLLPLPLLRHWQFAVPGAYQLLMRRLVPDLRRALQGYVSLQVHHRALFFPERSCIETTERLLEVAVPDPVIIAMPAEPPPPRLPRAPRTAVLELGWIGRLADFKMPILLHTLERVSEYARHRKRTVRFHVIGDGPLAHQVDRLSLDPLVELVRLGAIEPPALDDYVLEHLQLVFAMGLSVVNVARLRIPAVVLDISYQPIRGRYAFRWFFDRDPQVSDDTGHEIRPHDLEAAPGMDTLAAILHRLDAAPQELAERSFRHYERHHALDQVASQLLTVSANATLRFGDIDPRLLRRSLPRRLRDRARAVRAALSARPKPYT